ncbi:unnamed protein product [Paramecium pentaurelia]|uniref:Uncharacterized protein n=1 Tax=Paramecium pentaurelia TaxID=43138 RepID=A0A8S1WJU2_9CILI|nr:unnamed protein product [Paramecium pentaurelia]
MEVFQTSNQKQIRTKQNKKQFNLFILGKAQLKKDEQQLKDTFQYYKLKDEYLQYQIHKNTTKGLMLFQNKSINKSFIDASSHVSIEQDQLRTRTPDIRVLKRKQNGKVIFQTIPKMRFPQQQLVQKIDQDLIIQRLQIQTYMIYEYKKGLFFSERNDKRK